MGVDARYIRLKDVEILHDTSKALLICQDADNDYAVWVPWSVVLESESEVKKQGDVGDLVIKEKYARRKGII